MIKIILLLGFIAIITTIIYFYIKYKTIAIDTNDDHVDNIVNPIFGAFLFFGAVSIIIGIIIFSFVIILFIYIIRIFTNKPVYSKLPNNPYRNNK
jgi:hypothetical protein